MQELALPCRLPYLTVTAGVEVERLGSPAIPLAATGHGKGVYPEGRRRLSADYFAEVLQRLQWKDGGRITQLLQLQDSVLPGNAFAKSTSIISKKYCI
jgi:hypothetical protein